MAAGPVPFSRRGWDPRPGASRLSDMLRWQGDQQADAARRAGESSAQMWSGLGNTIAQVGSQIGQTIRETPRREAEARAAEEATHLRRLQVQREEEAGATRREEQAATRAFNQAMQGALKQGDDGIWTVDRDRLMGAIPATALPKALEVLDAIDTSSRALVTARRNALSDLAYGVHRDKSSVEAFGLAAAIAAQNGVVTNAQLQPLFDRINADPRPETVAEVTRSLLSPAHRALLEKEGTPIEVSAGATLYDPRTREPLYTAPKPETADKDDAYIAQFAREQGRPVGSIAQSERDRILNRRDAAHAAATRAPERETGVITQAQRIAAERDKQNRLEEAETDFRRETRRYTEPEIAPGVFAESVAIPQSMLDAHEARKRRIQASYLEQIGDTSIPPRAPVVPPPAPPSVRAAAPTVAPSAPVAPIGAAPATAAPLAGSRIDQLGQQLDALQDRIRQTPRGPLRDQLGQQYLTLQQQYVAVGGK